MHEAPRSKRMPFLLLSLFAAALIAAGCGDEDGGGATTAAAEAESAAEETDTGEEQPAEQATKPEKEQEPAGKGITLADSQFGDVLFDESDRAIYIFDLETTSESECYGDCAVAWPPVLTKGDPKASGGVKQSKLGTTKRDDGTLQVTYAGQPLYYYVDDPKGEVLCHNVPGFGGLWLAIDASGKSV